jgi:putative membrane protein
MDFLRRYFALFCKGVAMGAADVVPGVSGGTIAFISGIYEQLLGAIGSFNLTALKILRRQGLRAFWQHVQGTFLTVLFSGILLSVATFAHLLEYLLVNHPLLVWGFFFGLIVASVIYIWRQISVHSIAGWLLLAVGAGLVLASAFAPHVQIEAGFVPHPLTIFGAGMLAICAMILPGVSGSFILLLLGMYPVILSAVVRVDLTVLLTFVAGCATGLLLFSRLLHWLLTCFHNLTLALLTGFLVGSLAVVWPWQQLKLAPEDEPGQAHGTAQLLWPWDYADAVGDPQFLLVVCLMIVGLSLVLALEYVGGGQRDKL